jgi:phospholipid-translocating ATPase
VDHTNEYARCGLRTLFFTKKEIDQATFPAWEAEYEEARRSLFDRAAKLEAAAVKLEKDLILLGATAIEDKLQEGVPEAIAQLQLAGLKIWMLTGDKLETAVNIAHACSLLHDGMHEYVISLPPSNEKKVENETALVRKMLESHKFAQEMLSPRDSSGVIIDGHALSLVINNGMADLFVDLAVASAAVVCCRMSPLQKAEVVALVKHRGAKTLAIGDGANDVGMIQVADVGVGISGLEGQQAVMASDFSIAQFRFLDRLLLHHGRLSYKRFARMVSFYFYKNLIIGLILFYYDALSFFSGQTMFYEAYLGLYNVLFVAAPILVVGVFDQVPHLTLPITLLRLLINGVM